MTNLQYADVCEILGNRRRVCAGTRRLPRHLTGVMICVRVRVFAWLARDFVPHRVRVAGHKLYKP